MVSEMTNISSAINENKVFGVFLAEPLSDIVAATTTAIVFVKYAKNKLPKLLAENLKKSQAQKQAAQA